MKIGLALGGGGARGLAHIGILKVFEQERIPIDCISGSSMGGIIAAAYGVGLSPKQIEAIALEISEPKKFMRLMDVNPLRRGLLEGKRVRSFLIEEMGLDREFSQLHIPVALTATDSRRGEPVILDTGSVVDAVMATCAFPGIFQSVRLGNRWLVDGGMLNNVPVNVVRNLGAQRVIAVDVTTLLPDMENPAEAEETHRLPAIFPRLAEEIYQAAMIMTTEITRIRFHESPPDLTILPPLPDDLSIFLGFNRAAEAVQAGEKAARSAIAEIRKWLD
jgi:NTE family protein